MFEDLRAQHRIERLCGDGNVSAVVKDVGGTDLAKFRGVEIDPDVVRRGNEMPVGFTTATDVEHIALHSTQPVAHLAHETTAGEKDGLTNTAPRSE